MYHLATRLWLILILLPCFMYAQPEKTGISGEWVKKSNDYTKKLIDIDEKYAPEFGTRQGDTFFDTLISRPSLANDIAMRKEMTGLIIFYQEGKQHEADRKLKQDLDILINKTDLNIRTHLYALNNEVDYFNATNDIFDGIRYLLDEQTAPERYPAALVRLRKYTGIEKGYQPLTVLYQELTSMQMVKPGVSYPSKQKLKVDLSRNPSILAGIRELFVKYKMKGWEPAFDSLKKQLENYDRWVTDSLLPKANTDFKLPAEKYKLALENYGIDIPPADLASLAHAAFDSIQQQMKPIAAEIAKKYNLPSADYRSVMQFLKTHQITGDSIMLIYKTHLTDIEKIIRDHHLVTLPDRPAIIRLASAAETAQSPAPHMTPPPFLNNTGERGVFVLPLNLPPAPGEKLDKYDDFTFDAASWTIIAHEARPGHELQFDKMVEEGVSTARALYAFNSTNVEGWGLYAEYITLPYMPLEGQLVSLDYRLLRAARAFLDPGLQAGTITQQQAMDLLMKDVVSSHAFALQEVQRYTLRAPGQANSYFYGYTKMISLRLETGKRLGNQFDPQSFHDFILSQGILPPALMRQAVTEEFTVKAR